MRNYDVDDDHVNVRWLIYTLAVGWQRCGHNGFFNNAK